MQPFFLVVGEPLLTADRQGVANATSGRRSIGNAASDVAAASKQARILRSGASLFCEVDRGSAFPHLPRLCERLRSERREPQPDFRRSVGCKNHRQTGVYSCLLKPGLLAFNLQRVLVTCLKINGIPADGLCAFLQSTGLGYLSSEAESSCLSGVYFCWRGALCVFFVLG